MKLTLRGYRGLPSTGDIVGMLLFPLSPPFLIPLLYSWFLFNLSCELAVIC